MLQIVRHGFGCAHFALTLYLFDKDRLEPDDE